MARIAEYDEEFKKMAILRLRANGNNYRGTANSLKIPISTLRDWDKNVEITESDAVKIGETAFEIEMAQEAQDLAKELIENIKKKIDNEDVSLTESVNALEKLNKIQASNKAAAPVEEIKLEKPTEQKVNEAIERLIEACIDPISKEK